MIEPDPPPPSASIPASAPTIADVLATEPVPDAARPRRPLTLRHYVWIIGAALVIGLGLHFLGPVLTPFLIGDAIKLVLAAATFPVAWWIVGRRPGEG